MLRLDGVSLAFGGVQAIDDLSLELTQGVVSALIGPNGAGKTSVLNVISGLYRPNSGTVRYNDANLLALRAHQRIDHGVARSFQNVALFQELSVLDNLRVGADHISKAGLIHNLFRLPRSRAHEREANNRARRVLGFLGIDHLRDRRAGELSFGDRKMVDMGRALAANPTLLLLDEPVAGMAESQRKWLGEVLQAVPAEYGATVLLVDHDMGLVLGVSEHVTVMEFGAKIAEGTPDEIRSDERVIAAYLGED
jgi:ABC-type branched-subunit amino acid transport system ATPase component